MSLLPRPEIQKIKPCYHGGPNWSEMKSIGLTPDDVLDFSVCSIPFPPPPEIKKALQEAAIDCYPDSEVTEFRQCLAEKLAVAPSNIMAGNGSTELIRLISLTYFSSSDTVLILEPTFGEFEVACRIMGTSILKQSANDQPDFRFRVENTVNLIKQHHPKGIFICNPNNPTGQYFSRKEIEYVLSQCADSLLITDEAYAPFVDGGWPSDDLISKGNLVILRSMTKDFSLAGLRLGYLVANEAIIDNLKRAITPWNVNALAQKAGVIALENDDYFHRCKRRILQAKKFLVDELKNLGFETVPSEANFFLVRVGDAKTFRSALLKHHILVRDCTSFGLPEYVRIAPRTMPECQNLINVVKKLKHKGEIQ